VKRTALVLFCLAAIGLTLAGAQAKKVVVYTAHEDNIIAGMVARAKAEINMDVEFVKLASADVMRRVTAEAANPQADVIWSIGGETLEANAQYLQPYTPREWDKIAPVFKVGTNWLPYTGIMNVFIVNTNLTPANLMPKKWSDLTAPAFRNKVVSARADKSGSSYMQMANVLVAYPSNGWDVYKQLLTNFFISASSGAVPKLVNDGEGWVGITLEDNAFRYVQGGGPVKIVYPEEGAIAAPDGIALVKGAPRADNGKAFIDWCLTKSTQDYLVDTMFRRSVRIDGKTPPGLAPLSSIKTLAYDFKWAASNNKDFIKRFTDMAMELGL